MLNTTRYRVVIINASKLNVLYDTTEIAVDNHNIIAIYSLKSHSLYTFLTVMLKSFIPSIIVNWALFQQYF